MTGKIGWRIWPGSRDARTLAADPERLAVDLDVTPGAVMLVASRNHEIDAALRAGDSVGRAALWL